MEALASERAAIVATIDPDANGAAAYSSDEVDMSKFGWIQAILMTGIVEATGTVDFKLQSATTSGGSFGDVTNKAITQLVATDDDKQAVINLRTEDLTPGHRFVKAVMTVTTASADSAAIILGFSPRHHPASGADLASVAEIV